MTDEFVVSRTERGTPVSSWLEWQPAWPPLITETWERVVVVAAHPDDDVLGIGGLLAHLVQRGVEIVGIQATDGTAAYPHSPTVSPDELGRLRTAEIREAYARLGLPEPVHLGLPDGALADHEDRLTELLGEFLRPGDRWLAPWRADRHPDHEAAGRAAARACEGAPVEFFEYPIWMWHWAAPRSAQVPWGRALRLDLSPAERLAKRKAALCFRTQIAPLSDHPADAAVLPPFALERLTTDREVVFGA
ncbi:PIG-L family deacetylase [Ammonicoccus fulvus]|uniref:PIG-L family deacetylase n=1 Tax=Ammonicoccus fulvus TaxID=3138240 RepID=A0ABZ3FMW4_9ACTN